MRGGRALLQAPLVLIFALLLLTTCRLEFKIEQPSLELNAAAFFTSCDAVKIDYKFSADEPVLRCRYSVSSDGEEVLAGVTGSLSSGILYTLELTIPAPYGDGNYLLRLIGQVQRSGTFVDMASLTQTIAFSIDSVAPVGPPMYVDTTFTPDDFLHVLLRHPEWDAPTGSTVRIYYTLGGRDPDKYSLIYDPNAGITLPISRFAETLKARACDLAGNMNETEGGLLSRLVYPDEELAKPPYIGMMDGGRYAATDLILLNHDEWTLPEGSPVRLRYNFDGSPLAVGAIELSKQPGGIQIAFPPTIVNGSPHTFQVIAIDEAGNRHLPHETRQFTIAKMTSVENLNHGTDPINSGRVGSYPVLKIIGFNFSSTDIVELYDVDGTRAQAWGLPLIEPTYIQVSFDLDLQYGEVPPPGEPGANSTYDPGPGYVRLKTTNPNISTTTIEFEIRPK